MNSHKNQGLLRRWLENPLTRGYDLDDPCLTDIRQQVIRENHFLYKVYQAWYQYLAEALPKNPLPSLEIGAGAGFLREYIPNLIQSDILPVAGNDLSLDALQIPIKSSTLRAILMTNVLHHIPDAAQFFAEADRVLMPGGIIGMIEPWVSKWSKWVYTRLHHEGFDPNSMKWQFPSTGPLSGANSALPWIIFHRDLKTFTELFPNLQVIQIDPKMPILYLVSGGVSMRQLAPTIGFTFVQWLDEKLCNLKSHPAMFVGVIIRKKS